MALEPIESRSDMRSRTIPATPAQVYAAMSDATRIARWWGPKGFTSTIHQFDFKPEGSWRLTLHGPDGKDYPNHSRFTRLVPDQVFEIEHIDEPHFFLSIELQPDRGATLLKWRQTFDTVERYKGVADFVAAANEQNLDRLAAEVQRGI